ncbi:S8 family serine peptidase [Blastococcus brunescens]|uniref:S8 family serine peptidase n=1 Tax=Blastococcus brunescens TaxID=1564165 RepID=A0ABZ1B1Z0_9ACTN|nr:S8 family serine peptidase [Blastococcus sp. BMG 8361]WRL63364.1 S8 family serine peptidase [Blastococcus sp. BMG 8361]
MTPVVDADVDATDGWATGTGAGRIVAVVDSGFDSDHPELAASLWTNPDESCGSTDTDGNGLAGDCHGWNFYTNSADVDNGSLGTHGASVAGVIGGRAGNGVGTAGVAPEVTMMPLVIGGGDTVDVNLGARAIRYAVDHGADVITASWGGTFTGAPLQALKDAVAYAAAHDVVVVAAAGNDAMNRDTDIMYPASLPDPNVITVGNSTAGDTVSPSSAYGATNVDLFAPGHLVLTTWNDGGVRLVSGTSIAGPQVAAAYALYRAQMPAAGYAEVKQALLDDVDPLPAFSGKSVTGGRLTMSRLTGTPTESATYAFTSMTSPAGVVSPAIGVTGPTTAGHYSVVLGLGMEDGGTIWALSGKSVTLGGASVATDDAGDAVFPWAPCRVWTAWVSRPAWNSATAATSSRSRRSGTAARWAARTPPRCSWARPCRRRAPRVGPAARRRRATATARAPRPAGPRRPAAARPRPSRAGQHPALPGPGTTPDGSGSSPGSTPGSTPGTTPDSGDPDTTEPDSGTPSLPPSAPHPAVARRPAPAPRRGRRRARPPRTPPRRTPPRRTPPRARPRHDSSGRFDARHAGARQHALPRVRRLPDHLAQPERGRRRGRHRRHHRRPGPARGPDRAHRLDGHRHGGPGDDHPADLPRSRAGGRRLRRVGLRTGRPVHRAQQRAHLRVRRGHHAGRRDRRFPGRRHRRHPAREHGAGDPAPGGSDPGDSGSTPGTAPVVRTGPGGERLVSSAKFGRLGSIWSLDCSSSCSGVAI